MAIKSRVRKKGLLPTLAVGQPFIPRPTQAGVGPATSGMIPPAGNGVSVPEPATLIGDQTGTPYAKVGDRPDGKPETFIVPGQGDITLGREQRPSLAKSAGGSSMAADVEKWARTGFPGAEPLASPEYQAFIDKYGQAGADAFMKRWVELRGLTQDPNNPRVWSKPVSMATGGFGVAGQSVDPTDQLQRQLLQQQINDLNQSRGESQAIYAASQNVPDLQAVGMGQTLQNSENYKYAGAGVAAPTSINLPGGYNASSLSPLVRPNFRTQAQVLQDQSNYNQQQRGFDEQSLRLAIQQAALNNSGAYTPTTSLARPSSANTNGGARGMAPGSMDRYISADARSIDGGAAQRANSGNESSLQDTDPFLGTKRYFQTPAEMALQKAKDQEKLKELADPEGAALDKQVKARQNADTRAKLQGKVPYDTPDGQHIYISPQEAEQRKLEESVQQAQTRANLKQSMDLAAGKSALTQDQVHDNVVKGVQTPEQYRSYLQAKGIYQPADIDVLVAAAKQDALAFKSSTAGRKLASQQTRDAMAQKLFGKNFNDLTDDEKYSITQGSYDDNSDAANVNVPSDAYLFGGT